MQRDLLLVEGGAQMLEVAMAGSRREKVRTGRYAGGGRGREEWHLRRGEGTESCWEQPVGA